MIRLKAFSSFLSLCIYIAASNSSAQTSSIEKPVNDAAYKNIVEHYAYEPDIPIDLRSYGEWPWRGPHTLYKISYRSVREQRVSAYLAIPKKKKSEKMPVIVLMHGWNLFWGKNEDWVLDWISVLTEQGYAVLAPDHFLFGERKIEGGFDEDKKWGSYYYRDWMTQSVVDLRRGIDYLLTRPDIDPDRIAVLGGSLGGWVGSILTAVEPRIKASVLIVPATEIRSDQTPSGQIINSSNFFPRYKDVSLLVVIAKKDKELRNARSKALYKTAPVKKQWVEYDQSHYLDPKIYNKEILDWLTENL